MDPVNVAGLVAAALQLAGFIGSTIQGLHSLKGKFQDADSTIRLLIRQLSTIKAAVSQIQDWAEFNSDGAPQATDFMEGLKIALDGCQIVMEVISKEVTNLTAPPTPLDSLPSQLRAKDRTKMWDDATMKEYQSILSGQVQAWQLLLAASQS